MQNTVVHNGPIGPLRRMRERLHSIAILLLLSPFALQAQLPVTDIGVIPTPQRVQMGIGILTVGTLNPQRNFVDSIAGAQNHRQAYRIEVSTEGVKVWCVANEGWDYAMRTLSQLKTRYGTQWPCMTITDWPAYEYRGWQDDISRGPIPSRHFRHRTRAFADQFKMNFGSYYTEHTLYNDRYPDLSALSGLNNIEYAADPYMMANLQCFAHFEKTLRVPYYQSLMDSPTNLNPAKEETYTFLRDQLENAVQAYYSSHLFNINCDETEALGSGRARDYVSHIGSEEAYCRHINRVYNMLQQAYTDVHADGSKAEVLMWGDIVAKSPDMLRRLPADMQYIVWIYDPRDSYADAIEPFVQAQRERGTQFWVAPSVDHHSGMPSANVYMQNIAYLARDGHVAGARGLLNTSWDDNGESLLADSWHALAWGAEMAWHPLQSTNPQEAREELAQRRRIFDRNYDRLSNADYRRRNPDADTTGVSISRMIAAAATLSANPWVADWTASAPLMQPLLEFNPVDVSNEMLTRCDSVEHAVAEVLSVIDSNRLPHYAYFCHRIQCVAEKSRLRLLMYRALQHPGKRSQIQEACRQYFLHLHRLKLEYLRLWDEESTDYSRDIVCARFDQLGREVQEARQKVFISNQYENGKMQVSLRTLFDDRPIYFTVDGRTPSQGSNLYNRPFSIGRSCLVQAVTFNKWNEPVYTQQYLLHHKGIGHLSQLRTPYSTYKPKYAGGGTGALADGLLGSDDNYADGHWQGYWGEDIDAVLDLGTLTSVNTISMRFLQHSNDWILAPQAIEIYTSNDGKNWRKVRTEQFSPDYRELGAVLRTNAIRNLKLNTRYLRVVAKNPGPLPQWHGAAGSDSYLFCDEIVIE